MSASVAATADSTERGQHPAHRVGGGGLVAGHPDVVVVDDAQVDAVCGGGGHDGAQPGRAPRPARCRRIRRARPRCPPRVAPRPDATAWPCRRRAIAVQSVRPVVGAVHGGDVGQQSLGGADVAGGLVAADVLFAGLQRQPVAPVHRRRSRDTPTSRPGSMSLQPASDRHEAGVRSTEEQGDTEALGRSHGDVGALLAGRGEQGEPPAGRWPRWSTHCGFWPRRSAWSGPAPRRWRWDSAPPRRRSRRRAARRAGRPRRSRCRPRGLGRRSTARRLGEAVAVHHDPIAAGLFGCAAHQQHRLGHGGGFVEQGCPRQR